MGLKKTGLETRKKKWQIKKQIKLYKYRWQKNIERRRRKKFGSKIGQKYGLGGYIKDISPQFWPFFPQLILKRPRKKTLEPTFVGSTFINQESVGSELMRL